MTPTDFGSGFFIGAALGVFLGAALALAAMAMVRAGGEG